jgi:Phosphodiester glycosidase
MFKLSSCISVFFLIACSSFAQINWQQVKQFNDSLPDAVRIYTTSDMLDGRPNIAYCIMVDLKDPNLEFTTAAGNGQRYTPAQYFQQEGSPLVIVNGTFFSFKTNQNLNALIKEGRLLAYNVPAVRGRGKDSINSYYPFRSAIGINKKRNADIAWLYTDTARPYPIAYQVPVDPILTSKKSRIKRYHPVPGRYDNIYAGTGNLKPDRKWKMETAIGGGPVLVQNGKVLISSKEEMMFAGGEKDKHPRTAMGYTAGDKLIILVIQGRFPGIAEGATLQQEARLLVELGCMEALNLDGGGSSCMLVNGKETIKPSDKEGQRPVPGVFIIRHK